VAHSPLPVLDQPAARLTEATTNPNVQSCLRVAIAASCLASWVVTSGCATGTAQASIATNASAGAQSHGQAVSAICDAIRRYETALKANALDEMLGLYATILSSCRSMRQR